MPLPKDEIRVLYSAYRLGLINTDYSESEAWEIPIVDRLVAEGTLELSVIGDILGIRSFRITRHGLPRAKNCYEAFIGRMAEMKLDIEDTLRKSASSEA